MWYVPTKHLMNFHQILLLIIIAWCLGMLGLGVKQGLNSSPSTIVVQATNPTKVTSTTAQTSPSTWTYVPWSTASTKEPTLLEKAHTFAFEQGITSLNNISDFKPQEPLSREWAAKMFTQFAKLIYQENYFNNIKPGTQCRFVDKDSIDKQFFWDVMEACALGFMGWTDTYFAPKTQLSHQQANIILSRITQLETNSWSTLAITRWWLIELMLDQYTLWKTKK